MKIIFLGCGYLGYNLSELLKEYYDVKIVGLESPYTKFVNNFEYCDAFNTDFGKDFEDAIVFDTISILANNAKSDREDEKLLEVSTMYESMFARLKSAGIKKYYYLSSGGTIYGDSALPIAETQAIHPTTLYAKSKAVIEEKLIQSGLDYVILRLSNPYGGYQITDKKQGVIPIYIERTLTHQEFELWGELGTVRDYIYIDDFARAIHLCISQDVTCEIVNIGSGQGNSLKEIFDEVQNLTTMQTQLKVTASVVALVDSIVLDISKLKKLTGFEPSISLHEGIKREIIRIQEELLK